MGVEWIQIHSFAPQEAVMTSAFDTGMFVRKGAWHREGNVVLTSPKTWNAARKQADILWEAVEAPLFGFQGLDAQGKIVYDPETAVTGDYMLIGDRKRTLRTDTGATLGTPSAEYEVIGNKELGDIVRALTEATSGKGKDAVVEYETLISLEGGKSIVCVTWLNEPVKLPGDKSQTFPYLAVSTRHDGAGAARAQSTSVRIVCANTRARSDNEADASGTVFTFRHGANWKDRLEEARQTILGLRTDFAENMDFLRTLAKVKVTKDQTSEWLEQFIPMPISIAQVTDRQSRTVEEARLTVQAILDSPTCDGIRGSAYGLLAAGDEFLDHYRGLGPDNLPKNKDGWVKRQLLVPEKRKFRQVQIIKDVVGLPA
jgi:phage/plasmid-like protein (TIGR03299 family)